MERPTNDAVVEGSRVGAFRRGGARVLVGIATKRRVGVAVETMALALRARVSLACRDVASVSVFVFGASGLVERGANRRRGGVGDAESVLRLAPRVEVVSVVGEGVRARDEDGVGTLAVSLEVEVVLARDGLDEVGAVAAEVLAVDNLVARGIVAKDAHGRADGVRVNLHAVAAALLAHLREFGGAPLGVPPSLAAAAAASTCARG